MRRVARSRVVLAVTAGLLALLTGIGVAIALANTTLPAPTITSGPASPTGQTAAAFTYTDSQSVTKFQCSLDGAPFADCGTTRPSTKTYPGPLAPGPHTFKVKAISGSKTSAATSYTWTIDVTPPSVVSIDRADPSPSNAASVRWTVTFSESVTGVGPSDFQLVKAAGLSGSPAVTGVSGSGSTYTVTASTGTGAGTLQLKLVDDDSIKDAAGNKLGGPGAGNGTFAGQTYTIDKVPPPRPVLTVFPPDPGPPGSVTFAWTEGPDVNTGVAGFRCRIDEQGAWFACASPYAYTVSGLGSHAFEVRAVDLVGNVGEDVDFHWKVKQAQSSSFTISGTTSVLLYPGGQDVPVDLVFKNPGGSALTITSVTVTITGTNRAGCTTANFAVAHQLSQAVGPIPPGNVPTSLSGLGIPQAAWPTLRMIETGTNQDACQGGIVNLSFTGSAHQ